MRRISVYITPALLVLLWVVTRTPAAAITSPRLIVNGQALAGSYRPVVIENRIFVPLRVVSETLGARVDWDGSTRTVTVQQYGHVIVLVIGQNTATVDGQKVSLAAPARLAGGVTIVPLRFVSEALGADVSWDAKTATAKISLPEAQVQDVSWQTRGGETVLFIATSRPVAWHSFTLGSPDRIVIDLKDTKVSAPATLDGKVRGVLQVRTGQFQTAPDIGRVVLDLDSPLPYTVEPVDGGLVVHLAVVLEAIKYTRTGTAGEVQLVTSRPVLATTSVAQNPLRLIVTLPATVAAPAVLSQTMVIDDDVVGQIKLVPAVPAQGSGNAQGDDPAGSDLSALQLEIDLPYYLGHTVSQQPGDPAVTSIDFTPSPMYNRLIAVDPGHGGDDPGAHGSHGELEKDLTLDIGLRLKSLLEQAGARVLMIRDTDVTVGLYQRPAIANQAGADAYVSIHLNAYGSWKHGTEIYYDTTNPDSIKLATDLHDTLIKELGLADGGIRREHDFVVVRETTMPSSLVEVAYLTNPTEEKLLLTPAFRQKAAVAIYDGLMLYFAGR